MSLEELTPAIITFLNSNEKLMTKGIEETQAILKSRKIVQRKHKIDMFEVMGVFYQDGQLYADGTNSSFLFITWLEEKNLNFEKSCETMPQDLLALIEGTETTREQMLMIYMKALWDHENSTTFSEQKPKKRKKLSSKKKEF